MTLSSFSRSSRKKSEKLILKELTLSPVKASTSSSTFFVDNSFLVIIKKSISELGLNVFFAVDPNSKMK